MSNVHTFAPSSDFCWSIEIFGSYPFIILHFRGKGLVVLVVVVSGAAILVGFADQCGDLTSHNDHVNLQIGGPCCHGKCQHDPKGLEDPSSKDILSNCVDRKMKYMLFCINIKILICVYIYICIHISYLLTTIYRFKNTLLAADNWDFFISSIHRKSAFWWTAVGQCEAGWTA